MAIDLDAVFSALADPTRRAILARLTQGDAPVAALAAPFKMSQPAVSRHLKVLEEAGLISRTRQATARISHLEAKPLREATEWLAEYQRFWDERYGQLDELLSRLQQTQRKEQKDEQDPDRRARRRPVRRHHPRVRRSP